MTPSSRREFVQRAAVVTGGIAAGGAAPLSTATALRPPAQVSPHSKRARLRQLLDSPGVTVVPEAYTPFTARLAELNGFEAIYAGGNMIAGMHLAIEDWGLVDLAELVEFGGRIARAVSVPAIVDADQGGETALNVYRAVGSYERAGIAGFHIEDTRNPKHMGQGMSELMPLDEMLVRIDAAVGGRTDPDFVIIARSDCMILGDDRGDPAEAIRRGTAFAEAGADAFFCVGMPSAEVARIAAGVPIPLIALNIPVGEIASSGVRMDIHGVQVYQAAARLYETMLGELRAEGQFGRGDERRLDPETVARVMRIPEYRALAERWRELRG